MFEANLLEGKRILVTGGGTGLGKSMARRVLELGAEVAIAGRRKAVLDEAAEELIKDTGGKVKAYELDIRVPDQIEAVVEQLWRDGPLDGLVNNAAGNFISRTEDLSPRGFDAVANIVLHGTFYVTNAIGKRWIASGHEGTVLSILATWVWTGSPFVTPSSMSKAGIAAMTKGLAVEWGPRGIRLNAIAPGPFRVENSVARGSWSMAGGTLATDKIPMRRNGDRTELADLAVFLLSDRCAYINGAVIAIDGGQWLNNPGTYARYSNLNDEDWKRLRTQSLQPSRERTTPTA
ncbi:MULTISPECIES: SDR family oxidoreductase [Bradyrhizobium]|uniref:NAD(P)-dependent dehydrogenase, short-chain alcohol dehydrogenase family n=2 Tax=Bradyrhizobium TaxID=374 RepID=A0ABY0PDV8_9BRAD|nr:MULTISPECIES: SDR family oxidoreductase [Bradyrhizobium]SDI18062.1 NAD(P)-dependent dehydrogenase, short-chain alcohol dehydrogenase family [Bradyrhizobium ottawaense]SED76154.1 NAD(P)-dependent dehydrogenase, short-chain alcohol dehydrogenase family [Bradyrhizobium lablabi]SHL71708.1 NAD(P)-dependent dehydrogenase, short-chain alcohol dehydrogenase family [Bradyrhizobium lablabi]